MIFVCDFFVISKRVYEEKISDLPLDSEHFLLPCPSFDVQGDLAGIDLLAIL